MVTSIRRVTSHLCDLLDVRSTDVIRKGRGPIREIGCPHVMKLRVVLKPPRIRLCRRARCPHGDERIQHNVPHVGTPCVLPRVQTHDECTIACKDVLSRIHRVQDWYTHVLPAHLTRLRFDTGGSTSKSAKKTSCSYLATVGGTRLCQARCRVRCEWHWRDLGSFE